MVRSLSSSRESLVERVSGVGSSDTPCDVPVVGSLNVTMTISDSNDIVRQRRVLDLRPPEDPERSTRPMEFSDRLYNRFKQGHLLINLEEAIALGREALELCLSGHPDRPSALHKLARCVLDRFDRVRISSDLGEAIVLGRGALELCPPGIQIAHGLFTASQSISLAGLIKMDVWKI